MMRDRSQSPVTRNKTARLVSAGDLGISAVLLMLILLALPGLATAQETNATAHGNPAPDVAMETARGVTPDKEPTSTPATSAEAVVSGEEKLKPASKVVWGTQTQGNHARTQVATRRDDASGLIGSHTEILVLEMSAPLRNTIGANPLVKLLQRFVKTDSRESQPRY